MSDDDAWPDGLGEARRLFGTADGAEPATVDGDEDDAAGCVTCWAARSAASWGSSCSG